ncbi:MAG: RNA polymerase sigma factor, partial [Chitinophagaceae bacterium]
MDLCFAVSIKYLKDSDSAKDAVMDVFEELGDKLKKHDVTNFRSWLHTVVKNHCLMKLRKENRNKTVNLDADFMQSVTEEHQDGVNEKEWQLQQMTKCIDTLISDQKKAVELFYLEQKCYKEITEATGLDWNKVRSLIQNGRRNLKICMDKAVL